MSRRMVAPGRWVEEGPTSANAVRFGFTGQPIANVAKARDHFHTFREGRCSRCGKIQDGR